jgi:UDP-GlcNAc:undecaprenyl-phosphate/decaprenyl-phosphate GlcNAc-1-phosphate transferase
MTAPFLALTVAIAAALLLTPCVAWLANRIGLVAPPAADRWHRRPTALMGGTAIFCACIIGVVVATGGAAAPVYPLRSLGTSERAILMAATLMMLIGLVDDLIHLRPATKLCTQVIAAAIVVSGGVVFPLSGLAAVDTLFTVFWFLGLTNALNLLDNMDGVA